MADDKFKFLDYMSDNWLVAKRLKDKGDKVSLKKLHEMEKEQLVSVDSLE